MATPIADAARAEKIYDAIGYSIWFTVEQFLLKHVPKHEQVIKEHKKVPSFYDGPSRDWTNYGGMWLASLVKTAIQEEATNATTANYGIEPTFAGPDLSNQPNGPFEALEVLLAGPILQSRNYKSQLEEILKGIYQSYKAQGPDFKELYLKAGNLRLEISEESYVIDWEEIREFLKECLATNNALSVPVLTTRETAIKDGSTYDQMKAWLDEALSAKIITKAKYGFALNLYNQTLGTSKPVALKKLREWITKNTQE